MNYGKLTAGTTKTAIDTAKPSEKGEIITYLSRMGDVLLHLMSRLNIGAYAPAVACDGMNELLIKPLIAHYLDAFGAMLLGIHLEIKVVQQTDGRPEIGILAVAELICKPAHNALHSLGMMNVKRLFIVFAKQ